MKAALAAVFALALSVETAAAQFPNLPKLGENWVDVAYPILFYEPRNGLVAGFYYGQVRPSGFDDYDEPPPHRALVALQGKIATSGSKSIRLSADFPNFFRGWRLAFTLSALRDARRNYFGIGNGTTFDGSKINSSQPRFYQSDNRRLFLRSEVQRRILPWLRILGGFHAERWRVDTLKGPSVLATDLINGTDPTIGRTRDDISARIGIVIDRRDDERSPTRGFLIEGIVGAADSSVAGDLSYTRGTVSVAGYHLFGEKTVLAGRIVAQAMSGSAPLGTYYFVEASDRPFGALGGKRSQRAISTNRFLGEDKLFANMDVRYLLMGERQVVTISLLGFVDAGRVFHNPNGFRLTMNGLHVGGGGGPIITIGRAGVIGFTVGLGADGTKVLVHTSWTF
ncbi:MAG: BamA/TamA family outer membrane protein [Gemmatimonadales bacterium]